MSDDNCKAICFACNTLYERINEENPREYRCPVCQAAYRIEAANNMHASGVFKGRDGYLWDKYRPKND